MAKTLEQKLTEGRQYRIIDLAGFDLREDDEMTVNGYATTFEQPYRLWEDDEFVIDEVVDRSAFDGCEMSDVIMQYDHHGRVFARNANGTLFTEPRDNGLYIEARLGGTEIGRQLYEEIRGKYTTKMSYGYKLTADGLVIDEMRDSADGRTFILQRVRRIARLYDVSAVSMPANPNTEIVAARAAVEGAIEAARAERLAAELRAAQIKKIKLLTKI